MTFTWTLWLALFGLIFGHGLPGAVVGGITGFIIDSLRKGQRSRVTPEAGGYISPLFNVLGAVAKSDGRVSEAEIAVAERVMQRMGLEHEQRKQAIVAFTSAKYVIDYNKADQAEILPASKGYTYVATNESKTIAGYKASKYELTDQATGLASEAWFTKDIAVIPNYLTTVFDTTYGVPLSFTTKQNGIPVTTIVKQIKFEPVPDGIFSVPAGYQKITPKQFREMPVGN